ncbi:carbamate kinase [Thermoactinospora rubra]|uniref:carbamate kinase n=1 Tax=Thermoactinospora rubra TaxID=1088767 RepID=UPI000A0F7EB6|nr:carbamate kinase [Thermoactinospora rubra]
MRIVVAIGGNALLRRGERADAATQIRNVAAVTRDLAGLAVWYELLIVHGNGPQVGLLAEESERDPTLERGYPLDTLVAETQGMIGYWLAQGLGRHLPGTLVAALITQVVVDGDDPAFARPTKPVGPYYTDEEARALTGWTLRQERYGWRRVVPSPRPLEVVELPVITRLLDGGCVVVAGGGGGVPVLADRSGVEAVVDKDLVAALLAEEIKADLLVILTDVPYVIDGYGTGHERPIRTATPAELDPADFAAGSMRPKVEGACRFAERTGRPAAIGALSELEDVVAGTAGTRIRA